MGLHPENGIFPGFLGYSIILRSQTAQDVDEKDFERAKKAIIKGSQLSPDNAEVHYLMGRAFAFEKDFEKAANAFKHVLALNPKHREAASELRLMEMRLDKQKSTSFIKWKT
jgi:cytochrome c-type biogenesis protein CcmH/NrfG